MLIGDRLYSELDQERIICITGSLSGGKTRLAFDVAKRYWRSGFRVRSNVPHNFFDTSEHGIPNEWKDTLYKSYIIVDEGGEYIRQAKVASMVTRSAGKANYYVVFSGKRLPHKNLQDIIIKPRFDFYQNYGIPVILWRAFVNATEKYKFPIWQIFPSRVHGTYSTRTSSGGIESLFVDAENTVKRLAELEGQVAGVQTEAGVLGIADDFADAISGFGTA
jgi:hypothetical protein